MGISIKKNYVYNMSYEVITTLIPLITLPYVARILGTEGIGTYTYTLTVASLFILFSRLGVQMYGNRSIAMARDRMEERNTVFSGIFLQQVFTTFLVCIAYFLFISFLAVKDNDLLWVLFIYVIASGFEITWLFYGLEEFGVVTLYTIAIKLCSMVATFLLVKTTNDVWIYALITSLDTFSINLLLWLKSRRFVHLQKVSTKQILQHLKPCLILFIPIIAVNVYRTTDKLMLEALSTRAEVGLYQAASQLQTCLLGAITSLGTVTLPRMCNLMNYKKLDEVKEFIGRSIQFSMFCSCGVAFGIAAVASTFVPMFYGDEFASATPILWVLTPSIIAISWANVLRVQFLIPQKKDYAVVICVCTGAVVNVVLNFLLIPRLQGIGAAIGTLSAEFSVVIMQCIMINHQLPIRKYLQKSLIFIVSGVAMMLVVMACNQMISTHLQGFHAIYMMKLVLQIFIGGIVYLSICFLAYHKEVKALYIQYKRRWCRNEKT